MTKHLLVAGIKMTNDQHMERIKEFYAQSHIILVDRKPVGLLKLGVVALNDMEKSLHIRQLQIMPAFQGKGIGSAALDVVKKRALQLCLPITLNVLLKNPARALYLRHGFQVVSQNKLEYQLRCSLEVIAA
ncbi:GNAT family N-acetyltransferase [Colwellia sp. D2M02]|nr:GNAT family N-acetyltransferase [Colwellia sp. D2M02]